MADKPKHEPSPDQNDPTGHAREDSPSYNPAGPPANNHRPRKQPSSAAGDARKGLDHELVGSGNQELPDGAPD